LLDPENPADISRMLIVTFTNAAAAELRARITAALQEALREDPKNDRLETQLLLLPSAEIRTIDAFCAKFLRANAAAVGISPRFRIADEAEGEMLARSVMHELLSDCYEKVGFENPEGAPSYCEEDFLLLADSLSAARDPQEVLADALLKLFKECRNFEEGTYLLADRAAAFGEELAHPYEESTAYCLIADYLCEGLTHYADLYEQLLPELARETDPKLLLKHGMTYCRDGIAAASLAAAMKKGNTEEAAHIIDRQILKMPLPSCSSSSAADKALHDLRGELHNFCETKVLPFLLFKEEDFQSEGARLLRALKQLAALGIAFEERFAKEKRARNLCQYSDLESLTLAALSNEKGEPSALALEKREEYDAVYIDEYQDVNEVQHKIFSLLSKPRNRFMVGDIKQSIYRFRGADPTIFAALRKSFPDYRRDDRENAAQALFMQSNFRCDPPIINFTNLVFATLLGVAGESIGYREEDKLHVGKALPEDFVPQKVRLLLTKNYTPSKKEKESAVPCPKGCKKGEAEAHAIAVEIARLIAHEKILKKEKNAQGEEVLVEAPILPRDITVLMKSVKGDFAASLSEELLSMGIPTEIPEDAEFFLNPDVLLILALLNVINNPHRDIYLAGVLRSPLYAFTMDELVKIRQAGEDGDTLYDALLRHYEQHGDDEKCRRFLEKLSLYRDRAEGMPVWRLLRFIYDDTAILALSDLSEGSGKRSNLRRLYHYSRTFEGYSFQGLYSFLQFINRIIRAGRKASDR
ncbi:MAG: UvrD-helicase domain-containing protein, partial [Clostridia bacterium]|nr:UvrD-helicase domain-containing protein [Clostridia bacterium]